MEVKGGLVPITAEELLSVTTQCLDNIKNYNGEDDVVHEETYFSFLKNEVHNKEIQCCSNVDVHSLWNSYTVARASRCCNSC